MRALFVAESSAAALDWTVRLAAVAVVLNGLELVAGRAELRPGGLLDWRLTSTGRSGRLVERLLRTRPTCALLSARGATVLAAVEASCGMLLIAFPRLVPALVACFLVHLLFLQRHPFSTEGSDDMVVVLLGVATLRALTPDPLVQNVAVAFVAGQVSLAYLGSGLSKAQSRQWWSGTGLPRTLSTRYFGHPTAARLLWQHRWLALAASWSTIVWESTFVLALFAPQPLAVAAVGVGLAFHLGCAVTMSLSAFLWAFAATYPCFLLANTAIRTSVGTTTRAFLTLGLFAAIAMAGGILARRAHAEPTAIAAETTARRGPSAHYRSPGRPGAGHARRP